LVLTGQVTVAGTTTYWCLTDAGTVPAQGAGLVRQPSDLSATTGAVEVRAAACDVAAPAPKGYDWHGACSRPATGTTFALTPAGGDAAAASGTAAADGRTVFGKLSPGTYQLAQTDASWCHAESDSVDANGNVVVAANVRTTVWIFDCTPGGG